MPNGVRPGERRGGRKKGTPNKATRERALLAKRVVEEQQGKPGRKLAREVLDDFMHLFTGMAAVYQPLSPGRLPDLHQVPDEKRFLEFAQLAITTAAQLAPYQSPKLKAVFVTQETPPAANSMEPLHNVQAIARQQLTPSQAYRLFRDSDVIDVP